MFNSSNGMPSLSDIAAVTNNNDGFGGNNGWWFLIILFALFGGWGNRGYGYVGDGSNAVQPGYVLNQDFAILERKLDGINNGICSMGYDQQAQMNGINTNVMAAQNALTAQMTGLASQMAACCCDTTNLINTQSCNTRQVVMDATNNIIQNDNANWRALDARLTQMDMDRKNERIAELQAQLSDARLAASQSAQNEYIISQLRPAPVPAYQVANPYAYQMCCCNGWNI